jgi:hypothetical protein
MVLLSNSIDLVLYLTQLAIQIFNRRIFQTQTECLLLLQQKRLWGLSSSPDLLAELRTGLGD